MKEQIRALYKEAAGLIGTEELERKILQFLNRIIKKAGKKEISLSDFQVTVNNIIEHLNSVTGLSYRATSKNTQASIRSRINEGFTIQDFIKVHTIKAKNWLHNEKMRSYLAPSTLYRPGNFERYLQEYYLWQSDQENIRRKKTIHAAIKQDPKPDQEQAARIHEIISKATEKMRMPGEKK